MTPRVIIEVYERDQDGRPTFLALAGRKGEDVRTAGIGADESERRAIIGAVHAYFNQQERPAAVVVHEPQDTSYHDERLARRLAEDPEFRAEFERPQRPGRFVYTDESSIKRILREAADGIAGSPGALGFQMVYRDQGGNLTERRIGVSKVEDRHRGVAGFPETYLIAMDLDKDEPRTFRVDRIERLEAI